MDSRFEERLLRTEISRATGLLSPDVFWSTLRVAAGASGRPQGATDARLRRIAELTVAAPSTGATRDEFGIAMHLAEHAGGRASSITPASVASLRRIWTMNRTMMQTQSELAQLRIELDAAAPPQSAKPDGGLMAPSPQSAPPRQRMDLTPAALAANEERDKDWLEAGMDALQTGEYAHAARSFSKALHADPESASALRGLHEATKGVQLMTMSATQIDALAHTGYAGGTALGKALGFDVASDSPRSASGSPAVAHTPPAQQQYGDVSSGPAASPVVAAIRQRTRRERLLRRGAVAATAAEQKNHRLLEKEKNTVKQELARARSTTASSFGSSTSSRGGDTSTPGARDHV
jgi:hypothetical protein